MAIGINPCFNLCAPKLPACRFERGRGKVSGRGEKCQRCLLDGWDGKNRAGGDSGGRRTEIGGRVLKADLRPRTSDLGPLANGWAKRGREETDPLRIRNYRTDPGAFTTEGTECTERVTGETWSEEMAGRRLLRPVGGFPPEDRESWGGKKLALM